MDYFNDYKRFGILFVDDEELALRAFTHAFEDQYTIYTAANARDGLQLIEEHKDDLGILMTDQHMPGENGTWLLEKARQVNPRIIRILATGGKDLTAAIAAVNTGAIYKYIEKPLDVQMLDTTFRRALEFYGVQLERDQLLHERMSVLRNLMITDRVVSLGVMAAGLGHHIRNSLVAIQSFFELAPIKVELENAALQGLRDPEFWQQHYQSVKQQIARIDHLIQDLSDAADKGPLQFGDRVHPRQVLDRTLAGFNGAFAAKRISVTNEIPETLPELHVDGAKFNRLFELLLKDQLAMLPEGSHVRFTGAPVAASPAGTPEVELQMTDDGPGLQKEDLQLVFDPFKLRQEVPSEAGLNLMGCFFIVHHHGGRIEARSSNGNGTTFNLRLPVNPNLLPASSSGDTEFCRRLLLNDTLWQQLGSN